MNQCQDMGVEGFHFLGFSVAGQIDILTNLSKARIVTVFSRECRNALMRRFDDYQITVENSCLQDRPDFNQGFFTGRGGDAHVRRADESCDKMTVVLMNENRQRHSSLRVIPLATRRIIVRKAYQRPVVPGRGRVDRLPCGRDGAWLWSRGVIARQCS